jgi:hypothetical protein
MVHARSDEIGRYRLVVYPDAGEAVVARAGSGGRRSTSSVLDIRTQLDVSATEELHEKGRGPRSLRRSRSAIRRYATANRCNVLVTWTYADRYLERATSRDQVLRDGRNLVRYMRSRWGEPFPYVAMPEIQPERSEREGVEVYNGMLLVPRMPRVVFDAIRRGYPYGEGDGYNGIDVTEWSDPRGGARYASKALSAYASKSLGMAPPGRQAYRVGQGFQPRREEWVASGAAGSAADLLEVWIERTGHRLEVLESVIDDEGRPVDAAWGMWAL